MAVWHSFDLCSNFLPDQSTFKCSQAKKERIFAWNESFQNLSDFFGAFLLTSHLEEGKWNLMMMDQVWTKKIKPGRPFKSSNNVEARRNNVPWKQCKMLGSKKPGELDLFMASVVQCMQIIAIVCVFLWLHAISAHMNIFVLIQSLRFGPKESVYCPKRVWLICWMKA